MKSFASSAKGSAPFSPRSSGAFTPLKRTRSGVAAELSLGYTVDVAHSEGVDAGEQKLTAGQKRVLEVSLVRKGARKGCHILAYQDEGKPMVRLARGSDAWAAFDLGV